VRLAITRRKSGTQVLSRPGVGAQPLCGALAVLTRVVPPISVNFNLLRGAGRVELGMGCAAGRRGAKQRLVARIAPPPCGRQERGDGDWSRVHASATSAAPRMMPQLAAAPAAPPPVQPSGDRTRASGRLWFAFWLLVVSVSIGLSWDRAWHATHVFDTFYSPPHLFVYTMTVVDMILVIVIAVSPRLRPWFGPGFRLPLVRFKVPASLALLGGGFATLGLAGVLDDIWHSTFGLDETGWSTPHSMIGWGLLIIFLGFIACFVALRPEHPLPWYSALLLGYFVLAVSATPFLGPLQSNRSPEQLRAIAAIPVLAVQPAAQHTYRIYLAWNLTRLNPIFVPLSALWAGAALALVRAIDSRARIFLVVTLGWTLLSLTGDRGSARGFDQFINSHTSLQIHLAQSPAVWLPLPVFPAALAVALLLAIRVPPRWAWGVAGALFGALTYAVWKPTPPFALDVLLASPLMWLGSVIGERVYGVLRRPTLNTIRWLLLAGVGTPLLVGSVDLFLRTHTP